MTEYWVSQGNKWCDYCKIYIANNATSIRTHELGTRHKESVAKKLSAIRKDGVAKEREKEMALKDLGRIESKAKQSYERDLAARRKLETAAEGNSSTQKTGLEASQGRSGPHPTIQSKRVVSASLQSESNTDKRARQNIGDKLFRTVSGNASGVSSAKSVKGVASSLEVGKRKRVEKSGPTSNEEAAALAAREAARKRTQEREKALLGLYHPY